MACEHELIVILDGANNQILDIEAPNAAVVEHAVRIIDAGLTEIQIKALTNIEQGTCMIDTTGKIWLCKQDITTADASAWKQVDIPIDLTDVLRFSAQTLTASQKQQARTNIGVANTTMAGAAITVGDSIALGDLVFNVTGTLTY